MSALPAPRPPPTELVPWVPAILCIFLFLTVFLGPRLYSAFPRHILQGERDVEEGLVGSLYVEGSPQGSFNDFPTSGSGTFPLRNYQIDEEVAFMSGSELSLSTLSLDTGDINLHHDLQSHIIAAQRISSPSHAALHSPNLPHHTAEATDPRSPYPETEQGLSELGSSTELQSSSLATAVGGESLFDRASRSDPSQPLLGNS